MKERQGPQEPSCKLAPATMHATLGKHALILLELLGSKISAVQDQWAGGG